MGVRRPLMETRKIVYYVVSVVGFAFLAYFTYVRRTQDDWPTWLVVVLPFFIVGYITYGIWYARTRTRPSR